MAWFDWVVELLGSREWLLLMMIAIVVGAFLFPDYRMGEDDRNDSDGREKQD